jgi:5'-nucleotidase
MNDPSNDRPERGTCPLCKREVAGGIFQGRWLPRSGAEHEASCPNREDLFRRAASRKGDWMTTFSGVQFWPLDARPEEIRLEDIAHSLSQQCRFAGHTRRFYSIGEHSVRVAAEVRRRLVDAQESMRRLACKKALLHDATETYLLDVPRPLKRQPVFAAYRDLEDELDRVIEVRFGLAETPEAMRELIKAVDNAMLLAEIRDLMPPLPAPFDRLGAHAADPSAVPSYESIVPWTAYGAEIRFLEVARELGLE